VSDYQGASRPWRWRLAPRFYPFVRLARDESGATIVEFALVAVPFFLLIFGILEVGIVLWATFELENATEEAGRLIRTGQVFDQSISESQLRTQICDRTTILFDCEAKLRLDVQSSQNFAGLSPPTALDGESNLKDGFTYSPGGSNDVVLITTFYEWPLINLISEAGFGNMGSGNRLLRASSVFRSEPFPETGGV
jgi:Flp pilus assembly protein TadG